MSCSQRNGGRTSIARRGEGRFHRPRFVDVANACGVVFLNRRRRRRQVVSGHGIADDERSDVFGDQRLIGAVMSGVASYVVLDIARHDANGPEVADDLMPLPLNRNLAGRQIVRLPDAVVPDPSLDLDVAGICKQRVSANHRAAEFDVNDVLTQQLNVVEQIVFDVVAGSNRVNKRVKG